MMMKAISIRQPWAWTIVNIPAPFNKDIENRDWPTKLRGTVLIHASKGITRDEYESCLSHCHAISNLHPFHMGLAMPAIGELQRGGIVGQVDIVDCVTSSASPWFFGKYGFVLQNAKPLPFRPLKGMLGFFDVEMP